MTDVPSDFDAMGHPVPAERVSAAYKAAKEMGLGTQDAMRVVGYMTDAIERDDPYRALKDSSAGFVADAGEGVNALLDLTGRYRLLATLCSHPVSA